MNRDEHEGENRFFGSSSWDAPTDERAHPWSLRLRVGLALAGITALALLSMVTSIVIADTARGDAAAINQVGSLRMQSYKIASLLEARAEPAQLAQAALRFDEILHGTQLSRGVAGSAGDAARAHADIAARWRAQLQPMLLSAPAGGETVMQGRAFLLQVDDYVAAIDELVQQLQRRAESRIQLLRLVQGVAIFLTLVLVFATMYLLHSGIVGPLRDLMHAADRARRGDLTVRASHTAPDEIGLLGTSFNTMAEHLQGLYTELERQVRDKTMELRRSNQSLTLLYDAARTLTPLDLEGRALPNLIDRLQATIDAGSITVCLAEPTSRQAYHTYSTDAAPTGCGSKGCGDCLDGASGLRGVPLGVVPPGIAAAPLISGEERHGVLLIQYPAGDVPSTWKLRLADALAERIASAVALARDARQQRRLALMEERAVIARELHDSLAQSLSYLKIQVARLQAQQGLENAPPESAPVLAELREGLNTAYRHLRELLTTFRLKMDESGLVPALQNTVDEFRRHGQGLDIQLEVNIAAAPLDVDTEIHLLQITREALANVVHHAQARCATVCLSAEDGWLRLRVEDDGIGLPMRHEKTHHYGLHIMQERAESLGGSLCLSTRSEGGTRVEVVLPSRSQRISREGIQ